MSVPRHKTTSARRVGSACASTGELAQGPDHACHGRDPTEDASLSLDHGQAYPVELRKKGGARLVDHDAGEASVVGLSHGGVHADLCHVEAKNYNMERSKEYKPACMACSQPAALPTWQTLLYVHVAREEKPQTHQPWSMGDYTSCLIFGTCGLVGLVNLSPTAPSPLLASPASNAEHKERLHDCKTACSARVHPRRDFSPRREAEREGNNKITTFPQHLATTLSHLRGNAANNQRLYPTRPQYCVEVGGIERPLAGLVDARFHRQGISEVSTVFFFRCNWSAYKTVETKQEGIHVYPVGVFLWA